jgi:hypothetical protein
VRESLAPASVSDLVDEILELLAKQGLPPSDPRTLGTFLDRFIAARPRGWSPASW